MATTARQRAMSPGGTSSAFFNRGTPACYRGLKEAAWACMLACGLGLAVVAAEMWRQWLIALVAAFLLVPIAAIVVGSLRLAFLAIAILDIPLQFDTYVSYRLDADNLGAVPGFNVSLLTISIIALYGLWLADSLVGEEPGRVPRLRLDAPALIYVAAAALSLFYAGDRIMSYFELFLLVQIFLLFIYLLSWLRSEAEILWTIRVLFIAVLVEIAVIGIGAAGAPLPGLPMSERSSMAGSDLSRLTGTFGSPNYAAAFFAPMLAPALSLVMRPGRHADMWLAGSAFGGGSLVLILTFSRGGWIAAALAVSLLVLIAWIRGWMSPNYLVASALAILPLFLIFGGPVLKRLTGDDAGAADSRVPLAELAVAMIRDHPLLGVGVNRFTDTLPQYLTPDRAIEWVYLVHNKYLLVWAETGIIGLGAFLLFLAATLRRGFAASRTGDTFLTPLTVALTLSVLGIMVQMLVEAYNGRSMALVWVLAALIAALSRMRVASVPHIKRIHLYEGVVPAEVTGYAAPHSSPMNAGAGRPQ